VYVSSAPSRTGGYLGRISTPATPPRPCVGRPLGLTSGGNVPVLTAPPGARTLSSSSGASADSSYMSTRIQTTLTPGDLHDHYLRLLAAAGWAMEGKRLEDATMSVSRLRSVQDAGVTGLLVVTENGTKDVRDVLLRVTRPAVSTPPLRMNPVPREAPSR
jgi:hypothetical protein